MHYSEIIDYAARRANVLAWLDGLGDPIRLYREVVIPTNGKVDRQFGTHWTPDRSKAVAPYGRGDFPTGQRVILSALVPRSIVDEESTVRNMLRYGEYEVTLHQGSPLDVEGIGHGIA
jgi:hypothetical protein